MILIYIILSIISIIVFFATRKKRFLVRIALAFGLFILLATFATLMILWIGDKPLPGSVNVYPDKAITKS